MFNEGLGNNILKVKQALASGGILDIHTGEIYGKHTASKYVMYSVLKVSKSNVTLQNIDNPLSLFETTAQKLAASGYVCISKTPYVNMEATPSKRRKATTKLTRCPHTFDFFEERADSQRPVPAISLA